MMNTNSGKTDKSIHDKTGMAVHDAPEYATWDSEEYETFFNRVMLLKRFIIETIKDQLKHFTDRAFMASKFAWFILKLLGA